MLDNVIFGDNQFFGINHMSEEKADALAERFRTLEAITDVIDIAYDSGIRAFMLNTNARAKEICDHLRRNPSRYKDLVLYPSMPYAHKYATIVAEKGIFGAINEVILTDSSAGDILGMVGKGSRILFEKDILKMMQLLVDMEMKTFRDLNVKVIFLQNIVTDLLLGFGIKDIFAGFAEYVNKKYGVEAGFNTMNLPKLVGFLHECGVEDPIVCSSINKAGYFMNPDIESYEKTVREKRFRPIAMSVLASGAVRPKDAIDYVCNDLGIKSVVFGASSRQHIMETKKLIDNCC
ncbi:MAG: hypothetical protein FD174_1661 [Geobacteraceae bacterium]|nr:MAG: hypothetical protein FD174_1661 [Geobacteraceae bacterium]